MGIWGAGKIFGLGVGGGESVLGANKFCSVLLLAALLPVSVCQLSEINMSVSKCKYIPSKCHFNLLVMEIWKHLMFTF